MARHKLINRKELYNFYKSGVSQTQLAKMYEVSKTTIHYHIKKMKEENAKEK